MECQRSLWLVDSNPWWRTERKGCWSAWQDAPGIFYELKGSWTHNWSRAWDKRHGPGSLYGNLPACGHWSDDRISTRNSGFAGCRGYYIVQESLRIPCGDSLQARQQYKVCVFSEIKRKNHKGFIPNPLASIKWLKVLLYFRSSKWVPTSSNGRTWPSKDKFPNFELPFILHADASGEGLGAALYQMQDNKAWVIAYRSRALNSAERNYSAYRREFLALKWAITENFRENLYRMKCHVVKDSNPLTYNITSANSARQINDGEHPWHCSILLSRIAEARKMVTQMAFLEFHVKVWAQRGVMGNLITSPNFWTDSSLWNHLLLISQSKHLKPYVNPAKFRILNRTMIFG